LTIVIANGKKIYYIGMLTIIQSRYEKD